MTVIRIMEIMGSNISTLGGCDGCRVFLRLVLQFSQFSLTLNVKLTAISPHQKRSYSIKIIENRVHKERKCGIIG